MISTVFLISSYFSKSKSRGTYCLHSVSLMSIITRFYSTNPLTPQNQDRSRKKKDTTVKLKPLQITLILNLQKLSQDIAEKEWSSLMNYFSQYYNKNTFKGIEIKVYILKTENIAETGKFKLKNFLAFKESCNTLTESLKSYKNLEHFRSHTTLIKKIDNLNSFIVNYTKNLMPAETDTPKDLPLSQLQEFFIHSCEKETNIPIKFVKYGKFSSNVSLTNRLIFYYNTSEKDKRLIEKTKEEMKKNSLKHNNN